MPVPVPQHKTKQDQNLLLVQKMFVHADEVKSVEINVEIPASATLRHTLKSKKVPSTIFLDEGFPKGRFGTFLKIHPFW